MPRLLRREPAIDEAELELARARSLERLRQIGAPRQEDPPDEAQAPEAARPPIEVVGVDAAPATNEPVVASEVPGDVDGPEAEATSAAIKHLGEAGEAGEPAAAVALEATPVGASVDEWDSPIADEAEGSAEPWELSDDAVAVINLPSPLGADDEPTDNELLATELGASAFIIDERDDAWLNVAESSSPEHDGSESAAAIEIAPWPAEDEPPAIAAIEPAEPSAVQDHSIGDAAEAVADLVGVDVEVADVEAAEVVAVAPPTEEAASFDPPAAELVELEVAASPTNGHTNGAHVVADTTPVAVAPAEPDADIALVPPDDLTADGWASDWGVDVLAPDDLTAAAFGLTNGHLAVVDEPQVEAQPDELVEASDAESVVAEGEPVPAEAIDAEPIEPDEAGTPEPIEDALGVADVVIGPEAAPDDEVALVAAAEFPADAEPIAIEVGSVEEPVAFDIELAIGALEPVAATTETVAQVVAPPSPAVRPAAAPRPAKAAGKKRPKSKASAFKWPAQASCPYCAQLLVPAPTTHKRCPRCRQRVMVRRVEDRVAFLTEASVAIFESERRRVAESKHWIGPRNQWIRLAEAAGARPDKVAKVNESLATPESVYAARSVYFAAVDRSVKDARANHDWPLAVRIRRAQAAAVSKLEGSPIPPPDDAVELHRDAAAIELRGIGELAKEAELVGGPCCPACDADAGRTYRINAELHQPRLPHADCPRGLCGCHWRLSDRDRANLERLLRRGGRG